MTWSEIFVHNILCHSKWCLVHTWQGFPYWGRGESPPLSENLLSMQICLSVQCHVKKNLKKNFMAPFYGWGSTASRLEPLRGGSLLFTINTCQNYVFVCYVILSVIICSPIKSKQIFDIYSPSLQETAQMLLLFNPLPLSSLPSTLLFTNINKHGSQYMWQLIT